MRRFLGTVAAVALLAPVLVVAGSPVPAAAVQPDVVYRYRIVERGDAEYPISRFAHDVKMIFADMRSDNLGGAIQFRRDDDSYDLTIALASGAYIEDAAAVCDDEFSCRVGTTVLLNDENWRQATPAFGGELDTYRFYLLNHEVGHFLGLDHVDCPGGGPAPLMMQQSKGTGDCFPNGFPLPYERELIAARQDTRVLDPIPSSIMRPQIVPTGGDGGYWLIDAIGEIRAFGDASDPGSVEALYSLDTGAVGADRNPSGGLYVTAWGGELYAFDGSGRAAGEELGSASDLRLVAPIVGMAADSSDGEGYWQVAADGGVFAYEAPFYGSAGGIDLNKPIVGMAAHPSGDGYWLVAQDGGVFTYGDIPFYGSAGDIQLFQPIVGMAAHPSGDGYWLVAADGGVFTYGNIPFHGSAGAIDLAEPVVGMASTSTGDGYWLNADDGGVFSYGDARFYGSAAG